MHCMQRSVHTESAGPGHSTGFPCPRQYFILGLRPGGSGIFWSLCAGPIIMAFGTLLDGR